MQRTQPLDLKNESITLIHSRWVLFTGLLGTIFFFGIALISNTWGKNHTTSIWATLIFIGFGILGLVTMAEYFFARHRLSHRGIQYGRIFGYRGTMDWSEVQRVSASPSMGWFLLESQTGSRARISFMMNGIREFAQHVLSHIPKEKIERIALAFLMQVESEGFGVMIDPDSKEWQDAINKAQESLPALRDLYHSSREPILIKYAMASSTGEMEHVWGELQNLEQSHFRVTLETPMLSGDPASRPPYRLPLSAIEDWVAHLSDGSIRGGFTAQTEIALAKHQGIPLPEHIASMEGRFCDS